MTVIDEPTRTRTATAALARGVSVIGRTAGMIAGITVIVSMVQVILNALGRRFLASPITGTLEISQFWYVPALVLLGMISAQARNEHLRVGLFFDHFAPPAKRIVATATNLLFAALAVGFAWYSVGRSLEYLSIGKTEGSLGIPIWPVTFLVPVSFVLIAFVLIAQLFLPGLTAVESTQIEEEGLSLTVPDPDPRRGGVALAVTLGAGAILVAGVMFLPIDRLAVGLCGIGLMLILIFLRVPVAVALLVPSFLGIWAIRGFRPVESLLGDSAYTSVASWSLSVIPMFVFMGLLVWRSGVARDLYAAASEWLRWLPAGLAVGTNVAGAGMGAVSGSTIGTTYALARIGIPEMLKAGYTPRLAVTSVMTAGLPGQLIPPSVLLVIYAGIAETSIGQQLIAGVLPGVLVAVVFSIYFILLGVISPASSGRGIPYRNEVATGSSMRHRWAALARIWPVILLIVIVAGGMFSGIFTATEVAAVAAFVAGALALWRLWRTRPIREILAAAVDAATATGAIMFLVFGALMLTRMLSVTGFSAALAGVITSWDVSPVLFLILLLMVYLVLGTFMEPLPMMLLTVPLLLPTLDGMGVSPIWFGVFVVFLGELAILTPPVGILASIIHTIAQDPAVNQGVPITLREVFHAVYWVMPFAILFALLLILFPQIATALPDLMLAT